MTNILGTSIPSINITGLLSSTWIYVLIVCILGFMLIIGISILFFFKVYNKKIELYENISGLGYQKTMVRRARTLKLSNAGEEVLGLMGGSILTAYGRKVGRNTYAFAKGSDGYWYNIIHGDLDKKMAILDIDPVDKDVRMFHVAKDRMNRDNYLKKSFMEKYGSIIIMFLFLIVLIVGIWMIVGKVGKATEALASTAQTNQEVIKTTQQILVANENIRKEGGLSGVANGLVPAG